MKVPDASRFPRTMRGGTRRPPLATVASADAACIAVTAISCPMDIEAGERTDQLASGVIWPERSPGSSIPVRRPNPNLRMYSSKLSRGIVRPILMAPTLLDFSRISRTVSTP